MRRIVFFVDQPPRCFPEMDYLTFLLAILQVYKALCAETFHDTTVKLAKNMTLECVSPSLGTLTQMEWFKVNATEKESIAIFNPTYGMVIRRPYAEKVYFLNSTMDLDDMTLSFHNASEADVGLYACTLETFPQGSWEKTVQVVPSESFEGAVSSNSHVVSESGKNVTLTCELPTRQPAQQVTWEKIQSHQIDHLTNCNLSQGRGYTSRYRRQILTNCSQGATRALLTLPHVTAWDAGLYRCSFKASTGENATFVIRLAVTDDGKTDNQSIHFVAGGAALLLLFVFIIAAIIVLYNRRRRRQRAPFKESWETPYKATSNDRSPNFAGQLTDDTGEDIYVNYPSFSRRPKTRI